jgi:hypothetical protein
LGACLVLEESNVSGSPFIPRGNPVGGMFGPRRSHAPGSASIPGGTNPFGTSNPFRNMNMGGPQGPSRSQDASSSTQYSFSNTLFPFLVTLDFQICHV